MNVAEVLLLAPLAGLAVVLAQAVDGPFLQGLAQGGAQDLAGRGRLLLVNKIDPGGAQINRHHHAGQPHVAGGAVAAIVTAVKLFDRLAGDDQRGIFGSAFAWLNVTVRNQGHRFALGVWELGSAASSAGDAAADKSTFSASSARLSRWHCRASAATLASGSVPIKWAVSTR